ncbi:MAG: alpha/beta hydrolase [Bacilli bacterium]|nr:alpha/beta hydrolase [Bacilli bacterium]
MDFDIILHRKFNKEIIDYGIIKGNSNIFFIKAGQNGSLYGYNNKYLQIALNINKQYGSTVICSSNPFDGINPLEDAMEVIDNYTKENNIKDYEIYYMGHSAGALIGVWFGTKYPKIKRLLLINAPLMYNYHKTKEGLENFNKEQIVLIYGSEDQSINYVGLLDLINNNKVKYFVINGQDHHFSKDTYDFKQLPFDYLYKKIE